MASPVEESLGGCVGVGGHRTSPGTDGRPEEKNFIIILVLLLWYYYYYYCYYYYYTV